MPELTKPKTALRGNPKVVVSGRVDRKVWRRHAAAAKRLGWPPSSYIASLLEVTAPLKASR